MGELVQIVLMLLAIGAICLVFYRLFLLATGLVILGGGLFLTFMEIYGLYLLVTETELFVSDFRMNGWYSFTTFFVGVNVFLLTLLIKAIAKRLHMRQSS